MRTIRRLYFYLITLIALEVVVWGAISLARTIFSGQSLGGFTNLLAIGLSLICVGLPVLGFHWWFAQREVLRDEEERSSRIRAVFLYTTLMAMLIPALFSALELINPWLASLLGESADFALFGGNSPARDHWIALIVTLIAFGYFYRVARADWRANAPGNFLAETRRLYRYLWVSIGLSITIAGVNNLLLFLLFIPVGIFHPSLANLADGLSLILIGAPLWVYFWNLVQASVSDEQERQSALRLGVIYLAVLVSVVSVLFNAGVVLSQCLRWMFGEPNTWVEFFNRQHGSIAFLIPMGAVWAYYGYIFNRELSQMSEPSRRESLKRLFYYILSFLGLVTFFGGVQQLLSFLVQVGVNGERILGSLRGQISIALASMVVGIPLWLKTWPPMQSQAFRQDNPGDHARRSLVRRVYLYIVIFLTVIGGMSLAGAWAYLVIRVILGQSETNFWLDFFQLLQTLSITLLVLVYHWRTLMKDGQIAQRALGDLHADFPVVVLGVSQKELLQEMVSALQRFAPRLPVKIYTLEQISADGDGLVNDLVSARVVVMESTLALQLPQALQAQFSQPGFKQVLIPTNSEGLHWVDLVARSPREIGRDCAAVLRQLAEGQPVRPVVTTNSWAVIGWILGAMLGLVLLSTFIGIIGSTFF